MLNTITCTGSATGEDVGYNHLHSGSTTGEDVGHNDLYHDRQKCDFIIYAMIGELFAP